MKALVQQVSERRHDTVAIKDLVVRCGKRYRVSDVVNEFDGGMLIKPSIEGFLMNGLGENVGQPVPLFTDWDWPQEELTMKQQVAKYENDNNLRFTSRIN